LVALNGGDPLSVTMVVKTFVAIQARPLRHKKRISQMANH
jgi:hypothetical protein